MKKHPYNPGSGALKVVVRNPRCPPKKHPYNPGSGALKVAVRNPRFSKNANNPGFKVLKVDLSNLTLL